MPPSLPSSSRPPRRTRETDTRRVILTAAAKVFTGSGLAGARIEAIARAAGVNKALLYYYFKNKERLYLAVLDDQFREFNRQALALLAGPGSARSVLLRYVDLHFDTACARLRFAPLHQQLLVAGGQQVAGLVRRYAVARGQALSALLKRGMRAGEFRRVDTRHTTISIVALIVFYFSVSPIMRLAVGGNVYSPADLKRRKRQILDFIRHGLFLNPEAPVP